MQQNPAKRIDVFFQKFPLQTYPKRFILLGGAQKQEHVFYITRGYVRQYILSAEGEEQTVMIFGPKSVFPLLGMITPQKERKYRYAETLTSVTLHYCSKDAFKQLVVKDSGLVYFLFEKTLERVDTLLQNIAYRTFAQKAETKIFAFLLLLCQQFGREKPYKFLPFLLTHKDIADCVGVSRETVSIALKKLIDAKTVIQKNHFFGVNFNKRTARKFPQLHDILS